MGRAGMTHHFVIVVLLIPSCRLLHFWTVLVLVVVGTLLHSWSGAGAIVEVGHGGRASCIVADR